MCRIYIAWDFLFMGALESRHETELEGARSESRARRPPQTPPSGLAFKYKGLTSDKKCAMIGCFVSHMEMMLGTKGLLRPTDAYELLRFGRC